MKILFIISLLCGFLLTSCEKETDAPMPFPDSVSGRFYLTTADYEGVEQSRTTTPSPSTVRYDKIVYYVLNTGINSFVDNAKTQWNPDTSELIVEGLHEGNYRLLILAVRGDWKADNATIHPLLTPADAWLSFPENMTAPLQADYYYGKIDFSVELQQGAETITPMQEVTLKHLVGGIEFSFIYNNPYVRTSVESNILRLEDAKFYTTFTADQRYEGESLGGVRTVQLQSESHILRFMPHIQNSAPLKGRIEMHSRSYSYANKKKIVQYYNFSNNTVEQGRLNRVRTRVVHPDDNSGVLYMTAASFEESHHDYILQDDESKDVYCDRTQRQFTTTRPLQTEITDNEELHLRFYSPRPLKDATIRILIPSFHEPVTLAYLDSLPAFADVWLQIPATKRGMIFPTASGGHITLPPLTINELQRGEITVQSEDDYWIRLQKIKIPWTIFWGLFGGDPDKPDGGPSGNWMGIRPVHCREAVAFMLNVTYMFGLEEVVQVMRNSPYPLYGNDGKTLEPIDRVVSKMRAPYTLEVGLAQPANVRGMANPSVWGVIQDCYLQHYTSAFEVHTNFHELGHVMGYNHDSQFTFGAWAEKLMNNFYVDHIREFPIDSYLYLNSRDNPHRYTYVPPKIYTSIH